MPDLLTSDIAMLLFGLGLFVVGALYAELCDRL